ncbi:MAG: type IV toxin-antitoxin system AbiEi family antitoxin [Polyangiaceae bacterium]
MGTWLEGGKSQFRLADKKGGADFIVEQGRVALVVECKSTSEAATVGSAITQVLAYVKRVKGHAVPVVAVPFMGEVGKRLCSEADVCWFDLSGNAHIVAPGLRIHIEGMSNRFLRRGRPSTAFAPKSARVARQLLMDPQRSVRQQELARVTGLDDGFTSRIVRRLEQDGLVHRAKDGTINVTNPDLLLDAWAEVYAFDKHRILRGHVNAKGSVDLLASLAKTLTGEKVRYAATGLAAAWLLTEFAAFRLITLFVSHRPDDRALKDAGFREESRGANVWLVVPNDEGVFSGTEIIDNIRVVHPVQAYLDLASQPERAKEAADELRTRRLRWGS